MFSILPYFKVLIKITGCSHLNKEVIKLGDPTQYINIYMAKVLESETSMGHLLKLDDHVIYIAEDCYVQTSISDIVWVSSKQLIRLNINDTTYPAEKLFNLMIWQLAWNPLYDLYIHSSKSILSSPFPILLVVPNLDIGLIYAYPYLLRDIPVCLLQCNSESSNISQNEIETSFRELIKIFVFSNTKSILFQLSEFTQYLGFTNVIVVPNMDNQPYVVSVALASVSVHGYIAFGSKVEHFNNLECSIMYQKQCIMAFFSQIHDPQIWVEAYIKTCKDKQNLNILELKQISQNSENSHIIKKKNAIASVIVEI
ncbi:uncharacterized protein CMU_040240 [Cryptosporidium muris RN66]|uniref:Uncharacterized protein n=1 Tax=Cryptosporidium muris (strain RN66) TaxID=441375 RepID=B6A9R4_CRYMR|nr:uncharacterized protein CMU_040240 [Cryptosporidium muris RN66]EEA04955.1 hypothetical protein CMU_040240 [Cryptosporidium muris RN66]|eukprot:XP_002139304.1 hypothetical protein [Cryptosporidium muris RN66]